jgi:hypothetical protein
MCLWWGGPRPSGFPLELIRVGGRIMIALTMVVFGDAFIAKFSGSNLSLVWSTYFGGDGGMRLQCSGRWEWECVCGGVDHVHI